ncbi:LysR family transcriptional regulator, regulator for metE and metH [Ekhidna lutea]|uniref:LysR family transcriptional regulator, regulator for metE and metH n=1 Tax=Ekhidna lutea TaxID=447679 RepID=A0A239HWX7_EKHLU|nr:LysR family transcriptional regulator [Ekhidna lutea]SNS85837.1 LysR family transcriptional regulator, regulator for metE and metH [Ekhidna lutea]
MEIRHLKLIREVAETKSLTKAKDALFLSQSALSHQLKEIENQLGTQLFHRVNKQLILTNAGKMVLESAQKVLNELEQTELSIKRYVSGTSGTLRIATQCYTCYHWLPALMTDFKKEFPNVDIEIFHNNDAQMEDQILDGTIDLAVIYEHSERAKIAYHELFRDELFALVPTGHPWTKKKYVEAKDFEDQNVIIHSLPLESVSLFSQVLTPEGVKPRQVMQVQVTEAVVELVKAGMGVNVMAKWIVEPYLKDNRLALVPVTKRGIHRTWHAITLEDEKSPQYLQNFVHHMRCNIAGLCCCPN